MIYIDVFIKNLKVFVTYFINKNLLSFLLFAFVSFIHLLSFFFAGRIFQSNHKILRKIGRHFFWKQK